MTWIHGTWVVVGLVVGTAHAAGLWQSAEHLTISTAVMGLTRLLFVALVLSAAATCGGILPAAAGWAIGFFASIGILVGTGLRRGGGRLAP